MEHIANPLKAISEWLRVLKSQGFLVILVPNKQFTFDNRRDYTSFEHLLDDFKNNIGENDLTHLPEILDKHDLSNGFDSRDRVVFEEQCLHNEENRSMHHHVFNNEVLEEIAIYFDVTILENAKFGADYYLVAAKK